MLLILMLLLISTNAIYFKNHKLYITSVILLILFAGLRFEYGYDYESYYIHFNEINNLGNVFNSIYEIGYCALVYILKGIGVNFRGFLLIMAALSIGIKSLAIHTLSKDKYVSLLGYYLLFFIFNDAEQMRHGLALGICLYASKYILDEVKDYRKFYLLTVIAFTFHYSTIIFFVAPLVIKFINNKKMVIALAILAVIFAVIDVTNIISFFNNLILQSEYVTVKIALYKNDSLPLINTSLIIRVYTLYVLYAVYKEKKDNIMYTNALKLYYAGLLLFIGFSSLEIIASRGSIFFRYVEIILFGTMLDKTLDKKIKIQVYLICAYYLFKFITTIIDPNYWYYSII